MKIKQHKIPMRVVSFLLILSFILSPLANVNVEAASKYKLSLTGKITYSYVPTAAELKQYYAKGMKRSSLKPVLKKDKKGVWTLTMYTNSEANIGVKVSHTKVGGKSVHIDPVTNMEQIDKTLHVSNDTESVYVSTKYQVGEWKENEKQKKYSIQLQMGTGKFDEKAKKYVGKRIGNKVKLNIIIKRLEKEEENVYDKAYDFLMRGDREYSDVDKVWICHCAVDDFYEYGVNGVCNEYSLGFQELAEAVGVEVYQHITNRPMPGGLQDHAWNVVVLDDLAYPTDANLTDTSDLGEELVPTRQTGFLTQKYESLYYDYKKAGDKKLKYGKKKWGDFYTLENPDVKEMVNKYFDVEQINSSLPDCKYFDEQVLKSLGNIYLEWLYYRYRGYSDREAFLKCEKYRFNTLYYYTTDCELGVPEIQMCEDGKYRLTEEYIEAYLDWISE